jgi:hypothetical protein
VKAIRRLKAMPRRATPLRCAAMRGATLRTVTRKRVVPDVPPLTRTVTATT